jgi:hypothetical protein
VVTEEELGNASVFSPPSSSFKHPVTPKQATQPITKKLESFIEKVLVIYS